MISVHYIANLSTQYTYTQNCHWPYTVCTLNIFQSSDNTRYYTQGTQKGTIAIGIT